MTSLLRPPSARPSSSHPVSMFRAPSTATRPLTGQPRPRTGQSTRPPTARPLTAASSRHEGSFVVAVLEGRGVGREVGIAALDKDTGQVDLIQVHSRICFSAHEQSFEVESQLADCQTYVKTLHHLHLHYPSLVLVPDTFLSNANTSTPLSAKHPTSTSLLVQCIQEEFLGVPIEPVLRKYWNEETGRHDLYLQLSRLFLCNLQACNLSINFVLIVTIGLQLYWLFHRSETSGLSVVFVTKHL